MSGALEVWECIFARQFHASILGRENSKKLESMNQILYINYFFWWFLINIIPNSIWRAFSYIISTMIWFFDLIPIILNFPALEMTRETDVRKYIFLRLGP